jgi:hypothetical protein
VKVKWLILGKLRDIVITDVALNSFHCYCVVAVIEFVFLDDIAVILLLCCWYCCS